MSFLAYAPLKQMDDLAARVTRRASDIDFTAPDVRPPFLVTVLIRRRFKQSKHICRRAKFIHCRRTSSHPAAGRVLAARNGAGNAAHFLSVIFPHDQCRFFLTIAVLKTSMD